MELFTALEAEHIEFIRAQTVFFTATAPTNGRVNLSPKGMDTFRCLDSNTVAYLDLTGSGNETAAHLLENERLTIMFCSFAKRPLILRLWGTGRVVLPRDPEWNALAGHFELLPGYRQMMVLTITGVQTSCGYAVPLATQMQPRDGLVKWAAQQGKEKLTAFQHQYNEKSLDGLPTGLFAE